MRQPRPHGSTTGSARTTWATRRLMAALFLPGPRPEEAAGAGRAASQPGCAPPLRQPLLDRRRACVSMARRPAGARRRHSDFPAGHARQRHGLGVLHGWTTGLVPPPHGGVVPVQALESEPPCKAGGRSVRTANRCCVAATPSGPSRAWTIPMAGTRRTRRTTRWAETPRPMSRASWRALPRRTASPWEKAYDYEYLRPTRVLGQSFAHVQDSLFEDGESVYAQAAQACSAWRARVPA